MPQYEGNGMTETIGTSGAHVGGTSPSGGSSTRDVAKDEAKGVAQDAVQSGKQTAETAKQQAGEVAAEAKSQARALVDQTREQLASQGAEQQQRAATGLRSVADEITSMINGEGGTSGLASDLARQLSERVQGVADYIEQHEPHDLLQEVQRFARQRPGTFLAAAGVLGFIGGRMTRGAVDEARDSGHETSGYSGYQGTTTATGYQGTTTGTGYGSSYSSGQVSTAQGTNIPATTTGAASGVGIGVTGAGVAGSGSTGSYDYAEPAGTGGLASTSESVSRTSPHGDATASFSPNAPLTGTGEGPSETALIEDPAGENRFGGRGGQDPI